MADKTRTDPGRDLLDLIGLHAQDSSRQVLPQLDTGTVILLNDPVDGTVVQLDNMSVAASDCNLLGTHAPAVGDRVLVIVHMEEFWIVNGIQDQAAIPTPTPSAPTGPAGGDLAGSYPNPTLSSAVALRLSQTGMMVMWGTGTPPSGWLLCDGSAVSRTGANAALFALWGTSYGVGDGSTTFNLPDFKGRSPIGAGTGDAVDATAHALGDKLGTETHTITSAQIPAHDHSPTANGLTGGTTPGVGGAATVSGTSDFNAAANTGASFVTLGNAGAGAAANPGKFIGISYTNTITSGITGYDVTNGFTSHVHASPQHQHTFTGQGSHQHTGALHTHSLSAVGSGASHPNVQPSLAINFIVKL